MMRLGVSSPYGATSMGVERVYTPVPPPSPPP
eukprot:COSAG01_NODE_48804_length_377_cov_13.676259_1_plen_31_part_10